MTERSFFWDGIVTGDATLAPYSAGQLAFIWQALYQWKAPTGHSDSGVISYRLNELEVVAGLNAVEIKSGAAFWNGRFFENTESVFLTVEDSTNYYVGVEGNYLSQELRLVNQRTTGLYLARVEVDADGVITIYDTRQFARTPLSPHTALEHIETVKATGDSDEIAFSQIRDAWAHLHMIGILEIDGPATDWAVVDMRVDNQEGADYNRQVLTVPPTGAGIVANALAGDGKMLKIVTPGLNSLASRVSMFNALITLQSGEAAVSTLRPAMKKSFAMYNNTANNFSIHLEGALLTVALNYNRINHISIVEPSGLYFKENSRVSLYGIEPIVVEYT